MQQAHQRELTILDGGMGHLLKQWGLKVPGLPDDQQFLAGVLSNETSPQQITAAHKAYISAGCNCITTNSFAATQHNLSKVERQQDQQDLIQVWAGAGIGTSVRSHIFCLVVVKRCQWKRYIKHLQQPCFVQCLPVANSCCSPPTGPCAHHGPLDVSIVQPHELWTLSCI